MSDVKDKSRETSSDDEPQGPLGGERLAKARKAQKISVLEIAKELHLDEPKVRALERNDFDVLGAPVFAKGHLKKYAQVVQVDEGDVLADYYQLTRAAGVPPLVSARPRVRREMSPGPWIAVIVVIIMVATAYWWFTIQPMTADEPLRDLVLEETVPISGDVTGASAVDDSLEPSLEPEDALGEEALGEEPPAEEPLAAESEAPPVEVGQAPALSDGQLRLLVSYTGDCWTEVTDARGRRLFFGMGTDGRTVELSGEAPFNVLFGNVANVRLLVNGSDRPIAAAERRGRTAKLTIPGT